MKFDKLAQLRYSVRRFDQRPVESRKIEMILRAAQAAPSAMNEQSWRVMVINDRHALEMLKNCTACHYNAPLAFLICYDKNAEVRRETDGAGSGMIDASIAGTHMMLQACDIGIGSTWVMSYDPEKMRKAFLIPDNIVPVGLLVCGYPRGDSVISERHSQRKPLETLCCYNTFRPESQQEELVS